MEKDRSILPLIFFVSLSSLAYEITLMRIFSISLWYHFAFMVISIAMLGIAASGTLLSRLSEAEISKSYTVLYPAILHKRTCKLPTDEHRPLRPCKALLGQEPGPLPQPLLPHPLIPFFSFGLVISSALSTMTKATGHISVQT